jgi:hypothetical protein
MVWGLIRAGKGYNLKKDPPRGGLLVLVLLNLLPVAAIAIASWYGHAFTHGLLQVTQSSFQKLLGSGH